MFHWWFIPLFAVLVIAIWFFYATVRRTGGPGVRTEGRTVLDKPQEHDEPPPSA
jgi:hypothetical protein